MKTSHLPSSRGFSLIELLLVLAIVAALAVAAFIVYPKVQAGRNADAEAKIIIAAQAGVKAMITTKDYRNITNEVAVNAEIFPAHMKFSDTEIRNQWGGEVDIYGSTTGATVPTDPSRPARYFTIRYRNVPTEVCIRLVGQLLPHFGAVRLSSSNGVSGHGEKVKDLFTNPQIDPDEEFISQKCKAEGDKGVNSVTIAVISD